MNNLESCKLKPLDDMNNSRVWMIWTILGCESKDLNVINNSRLWITWTTQGRELKALKAYEQLKVVVDMNYFRLWS